MIHRLASRIASIFVMYGESSKEDKDIYTYACEAVLALLFNVLFGIIISILFGRIVEGLIFILAFAVLRRYAGGHHASSHLKCILIFNCVLSFAMLAMYIVETTLAVPIASLALVGIFVFTPVEHENKISGEEYCLAKKKKSKWIALAFWLLCVVDVYILNWQFSFMLSLSMLSVFGSMAYAILYSRIKRNSLRHQRVAEGGEREYEKSEGA